MAGLFSQAQMDQINAIAAKSKTVLKPVKSSGKISSKQKSIEESSQKVLEYFKDSPAILITSREQLHEYVLKAIESGYCGIDTETTGLDRIHDTIVGTSLYYPGGVECYIPSKHKTLVDTYYKNQLTYEEVGAELQLFVEAKTKMIFANADFDLAMIYKDLKVDLVNVCYYDVISAWRCLKEDEPDNALKVLYWKYPNKKQGSPKKFSDLFSPKLFPYSNPEVAKLYAANDAKITYELFVWQLPYVTKSHPKCQKNHLEKIADLLWNLEIPMIRVCALMHRTGVYLDTEVNHILKVRYETQYQVETVNLANMVQEIMDQADAITLTKSPFHFGKEFNEGSSKHVIYLLNSFLGCQVKSGDKETLTNLNLPITNQILKVRAIGKLLNSFIDRFPNDVGPDGRIHATFKALGTDTGRFSCSDPNVQQIPSHATDIRHQFRATPAMVKIDVCEKINDIIQITLGSYDSIIINGGEHKDVIDLCVGDEVVSVNGIMKIIEVNHHLPYTTLSFDSSFVDSIKHTTPAYVMMSSDYSQQEPKLLAYCSADPNMIDAFAHNRDIYSTIAALAFNTTYEDCSEFFFDENGNKTDQVNREGKERRTNAKSIVLGISYGRSTKTIGDQLFGKNKDMTDDERTKAAQGVYDAVLAAFPNLKAIMQKTQNDARTYGYVETILGRRRHIPDMQLKPYEFKAGKGYVNPDIDPLDSKSLKAQDKVEIPERIVKKLEKEFANYKHNGQVYKRTKLLEEQEHIKVINNTRKITDATRKCLNSLIQGSAADLTKIAMLKIFTCKEWEEIGARILLPVHDELIAEVPIRNAKRAGELLSGLMSEAGNFLPFTISCDVTTSYKWYGLEHPCPYTIPTSFEFDQCSEDEIKWIQYHIFECEYVLPIYKDKDGKKPMGDAALGVNGIWSEELETAINDYMQKYQITKEQFVDHIKNKVIYDLQI